MTLRALAATQSPAVTPAKAARRAGAEQQDEQRGPDDVELLLGRERPRVRPVELGTSGLDDVRDVESRREDEPSHQGLEAVVHPRVGREAGEEEDAQRREEPQHAAHVEAAQRDSARAVPLVEQERGDQEALRTKKTSTPTNPPGA